MSPQELLKLVRQDEGLQEAGQGLKEGLAGALRSLTVDTAGAPVDLLAMLFNSLGLKVGDKPFGGSAHLREKLGQPKEEPTTAGKIGQVLGSSVNPETVAKLLPLALGVIRPFGAKNLALVHNMPADERALEFFKSGKPLGNPSIAIADQPYPFNSTPTFIFNPDSKLFDPAGNPQNQLFNRDAYTDRARDFLQRWGRDYRLGEAGKRTKDIRMTEGHNPGESHQLAIWGSPRFQSFQDYESKKSGAGTLGQEYLKASSDLHAEVTRYLRDNAETSLAKTKFLLDSKTSGLLENLKPTEKLSWMASQGDKEAQKLLQRASELGSDYAELKVVGQVPVDRRNVNAILLPHGGPFGLEAKDILEFMKEGKKKGIPTGTAPTLASKEIKDKAEEAVQRMAAEGSFYTRNLRIDEVPDMPLSGYGDSSFSISSVPSLQRYLMKARLDPEVYKPRAEDLLRRQVWSSPELTQELLQQLSASAWAKK